MMTMMMRIDAHVHFTPPELAENLGSLAEREPYWSLLLDPPDGRSIQGYASAERMVGDMDAAGIDKVVLVGEYFYQHESCVARNNIALDLIQKYPERIMAMATIQPNAGQKAVDELKRCLAGGLLGMGELNPYAQGFRLDAAVFAPLVELCIEADVPLNLHVSEEIGGYYLGKSTTPLRHYYELACRYPALKLILAHWGGGLLFYELMPRVRKQLANVFYDTAASPLLYPTKKIFATALSCVDRSKILYGSDYPLLIYPRQMREPDFRPFLAAIDGLGLEEDVAADVLGRNAASVFSKQLSVFSGDARIENVARRDASPSKSKIENSPISLSLPVALIAQEYPETQVVLARYNIPWRDEVVPSWEPLGQAAVAQGLGRRQQAGLLAELAEIVGVD